MAQKASLIRLGAFIILGFAVLVLAVFYIGGQEGLFRETFPVSAYFEGAEGIRTGSAVRLAGVDIGVVDRVAISPEHNNVRLDLKLNTDVRRFVKTDSYATIEPEGLVGNKFVAITVGSPEAEEIGDQAVLQSKEPVRLADILQDAKLTAANTRRATEEFAAMLESVNRGKGTLGKLVTEEGLYLSLQRSIFSADSSLRQTTEEFTNVSRFIFSLAGTIGDVVFKADSVVTNVNEIVAKVNAGQGMIGALLADKALYDSLLQLIGNAVAMTQDARIGASKFAENMEALKHNWFFRGYFEDRGYWDKADFEQRIDEKLNELRVMQQQLNEKAEKLKELEQQLRERQGNAH
ncbi:MAG: MlaD family protein [Ignavibacteria bacterium]|nr:MlaD family protein [Ignavibacteria bacterium]